MPQEKVRLTLGLDPALHAEMLRMCAESDITFTEFLRRALALLQIARKAMQEGKSVGFTANQADLDTVVIGI